VENVPRYSSAVLLYVLHASRILGLSRSLITPRQMLQYNGKSHALETASEKFRHELYSYENGDGSDSWEFAGLIGQRLSLHEHTAGVDRALEVLQSRVAAAKREKDAQTYVFSPFQQNSTVAIVAVARKSHDNNRHNITMDANNTCGL
jgi:hypothetical protein